MAGRGKFRYQIRRCSSDRRRSGVLPTVLVLREDQGRKEERNGLYEATPPCGEHRDVHVTAWGLYGRRVPGVNGVRVRGARSCMWWSGEAPRHR